MLRQPKLDEPVIIIRSGYATEALWLQAIATSRGCGRRIIAVDLDGGREEIEPEP